MKVAISRSTAIVEIEEISILNRENLSIAQVRNIIPITNTFIITVPLSGCKNISR